MSATYALTVSVAGREMFGPDFRTMDAVRRTLLGLASHGFVTDVESHSDATSATWSYHAGSEDPGGIMDGLVTVVKQLAPTWAWRVSVDGVGGPWDG